MNTQISQAGGFSAFRRSLILSVALIVQLVFATEPLKAQYIDPGTGSYIFQLAIAGIFAVIYWWKSILGFLKKKKKEQGPRL